MRKLMIPVFVFSAVLVWAQDEDKMNMKLAKTAVEKHNDYEQAEKYLNRINLSSPLRDSIDFLIFDALVNANVADSSLVPKPDNYRKALNNYEKVYFLTRDELLIDRIAELRYKYDKAREPEKENPGAKASEADSVSLDSAMQAYISGKQKLARFNLVLHKPAWHAGLNLGFNFDYYNYGERQTDYHETRLNDVISDSITTTVPVYKANPGMGLMFGFEFHPYMSDYVAVGLHCSGTVGTTHLIFSGGGEFEKTDTSKYFNDTEYLYGSLNYGIEFTAGWYWIKVLAVYDHSLRHTSLSYFEDEFKSTTTAGGEELKKHTGRYEFEQELRHEELTFGLRLFPYTKDKLRIKRPCLLDLAYTLNRDYDFGFKNSTWSYASLNNFYHGFKVKLWVESILGASLNISFPEGYFKVKNSNVNTASAKWLPFISLSLFYTGDFFGLGYKGR